jgi:glycosyltransferase involved in cell wall biosynthesis
MTAPTPRWSIVVPLHNMARTIERTVASIVAQSEASWELLVVDDGSTDASAALVESVEDRRVSLVRQANAGVSAARNRGIAESRASLIAFLDADDYWAPGHLANLGRLVDDFPNAVLYGTAYELVFESGSTRRVRLRPGVAARAIMTDYFTDSVEFEVPICASGVAAPKSALERVEAFPVGVHTGEDLITWARLACIGDIAYSTEATSYVTPPAVDARNRANALRTPDHDDYVGTALAELAAENPDRARSIQTYLAWWHRLCALTYAETSAPLRSLARIWKAVALDRPTTRDGMIAILSVMPRTARAHLLARNRLGRRERNLEAP